MLRAGKCLILPQSMALPQVPDTFPLSPKRKPPSPLFPSPTLIPPLVGKTDFPYPNGIKCHPSLLLTLPSHFSETTPTRTSPFYTSTYPYRRITTLISIHTSPQYPLLHFHHFFPLPPTYLPLHHRISPTLLPLPPLLYELPTLPLLLPSDQTLHRFYATVQL